MRKKILLLAAMVVASSTTIDAQRKFPFFWKKKKAKTEQTTPAKKESEYDKLFKKKHETAKGLITLHLLDGKVYFELPVDLINKDMLIGSTVTSISTGKCSATGTLNTLQAKEGYSLQYLYYMLKVFNFEPYKTGMAIPHIYFKDYGKAKIFCPSYTEQLKYVGVLSTIDNKLSAEQSILTDLSLQKQYLLHQMFI